MFGIRGHHTNLQTISKGDVWYSMGTIPTYSPAPRVISDIHGPRTGHSPTLGTCLKYICWTNPQPHIIVISDIHDHQTDPQPSSRSTRPIHEPAPGRYLEHVCWTKPQPYFRVMSGLHENHNYPQPSSRVMCTGLPDQSTSQMQGNV